MKTTPDFSLLHATARLPDGWRAAYTAWMDRCANRRAVEYVLVTDARDRAKTTEIESMPFTAIGYGERWCWLINHKRPCTVDAWNLAAGLSLGKVLVVVSDDWFPCDRWDEVLRRAIPDMSKEVCVWPADTGGTAGIMICPILTRAYYERPGRGGHPNGELFYPDYISVGSDDDFTEVAQRDGVIVRIPEVFEHRHPSAGLAQDDDVYKWSNRKEAWDRKVEVQARRRECNFAR
jgi:hypothetical protein